jgi:serine/threonine-protein kinase HipA
MRHVEQVRVLYDTGVGEPASVGRLRAYDGRCYFQFDPEWRARALRLSPLEMPVTDIAVPGPPINQFGGLHPVFHDSLPDGWGRLLIDREVARRGIAPATLTPVDRLALVGARGMGALSYRPDEGASLFGDDARKIDVMEMAAQAERIYEGSAEDVLPQLLRDGGSPMGARPKALLTISANGRTVRSGTLPPAAGFVPHLVKFPTRSEGRDAGMVEEAYARMARTAGIAMPPTRLLMTRDHRACFAIARFDRRGVARIHMQTLGAMIGAQPIDAVDYASYLACTLRVTEDQRAVREAFRRAVFNVLAHNRDDHVRNFAYLMEPDGTWVLAPAYDLTFNEGRRGRHALSYGGEDTAVTTQHLHRLAQEAGIVARDVMGIVEQVDAAVAQWPTVARDLEIAATRRTEIGRRLEATRRAALGSAMSVGSRTPARARRAATNEPVPDRETRRAPAASSAPKTSRKPKVTRVTKDKAAEGRKSATGRGTGVTSTPTTTRRRSTKPLDAGKGAANHEETRRPRGGAT